MAVLLVKQKLEHYNPVLFYMKYSFQVSTSLSVLTGEFSSNSMGKKALNDGRLVAQKLLLWATLGMALLFVYLQFQGFSQIIDQGYYFTGAESSITTSFLYVLVLLHLAHVFGGLIVLSIIMIKTYKNTYSPSQKLGYELAELFWHFLDFLWIYLYVFVTLNN